ncbi:MAG: XRE family transcriptional regulator [Candidatus Omnitrophica bacterium]|nr:XRE family transcriptional regulator [Candidatus Omnitrophota bacterium]MCK5591575.1 XRE family transcriptional regulator [Candidatus Paceibacterota bacterium]
MTRKTKHIGSSFDDFLKEEGLFEESQATAVKRVIAYQIMEAMRKKHISKIKMTRLMHIKSRMPLDRLLDPNNNSVTLLTLEKAATALGKKLKVQLV